MGVYMGEDEVIKKNMALAQEKFYTVENMEALSQDVRAELIDGRLFYMAAPTTEHQRLLSFLHGTFWNYIRERKGKCQVYPAPLAVYLNRDNYTSLEPDLTVVCDSDKMGEKGCYGAPDFIAEIVSPSTQSRDYLLKLNKYQNAGVREYWILDAEKNTIHVYDFEGEKKDTYGFEDTIKVGIFRELEVDFSEFVPNPPKEA